MRVGFRILDRGCSRSPYDTKSTSIQSFIDVYAGPLYYMHFKYSSILTVTFVTFMYGFGIPIMFPIACASMIVLYFVGKTMLFYAYRVPPMYDERLSQNVLRYLQFAPLFFCFFGYWMISNEQLLLNNHLQPVSAATEVHETGHTIQTVLMKRGWAGLNWVLLVAGIILTAIFFFGNKCMQAFSKLIPSL